MNRYVSLMWNKKNTISLIVLLKLTLITAALASMKSATLLILIIAVIKFLLVAFQFMELKKAHLFWKAAITILILFITGIIFLVLRA
jgi:Prokaryotic Cytochrome C oxidase subunit IV